VSVSIGSPSPDIAQGVNRRVWYREVRHRELDRQGACDQGLMLATPCGRYNPRALCRCRSCWRTGLARAVEVRRAVNRALPLPPDGKTQVTIEYQEGDTPCGLTPWWSRPHHAPDINQGGGGGAVRTAAPYIKD